MKHSTRPFGGEVSAQGKLGADIVEGVSAAKGRTEASYLLDLDPRANAYRLDERLRGEPLPAFR